jgi:CRISPR-associated protein Cas5d
VHENNVSIRVWGDFACFTRPEMKVERVSYPVMTPSAARGILEAIFWEPQMYYIIDKIGVLKKGRWVSFRRNEVEKVVSLDSAQTWMKSPDSFTPIPAGGGVGTQRNTLALEGVEYIITAEVHLSGIGRNENQLLPKYREEIERRARQGKCFHRPALGVREFAADFEWVEKPTDLSRADWKDEDLGLMLYDVFDYRQRAQGFQWLTDAEEIEAQAEHVAKTAHLSKDKQKSAAQEVAPRFKGVAIKPRAAFFNAAIHNAELDCHPDRVRLLTATAGED